MLKQDPRDEHIKNQGHHFLTNKKNPVNNWVDKIFFGVVKGKPMKDYDLKCDLLEMLN